MASIVSEPENEFVKGLTGGRNAWLGGTKLADGTWSWTDGLQWGYTKWSQQPVKEPNNRGGNENSLALWRNFKGSWNDAPFQQKHAYVCQYLDLSQF